MQLARERHASIAWTLAMAAAAAFAPVAVARLQHRTRHPHARRASAETQRSCQQAGPCRAGFQHFDVAATTAPSQAGTPSQGSTPSPRRGTLHVTQDVGVKLTCQGYQPKDPNWFNFYVGGTDPSGIGFSVAETVLNTDADHVRFCLGAPYSFKTRSGDRAQRAPLPNGDPGYVGLLASCPPSGPAGAQVLAFTGSVRRPARAAQSGNGPCVAGITTSKDASSNTGLATTVTVSIPGGDPWGRA
jgi:hypothetical protein